jgi:hypothetical protein
VLALSDWLATSDSLLLPALEGHSESSISTSASALASRSVSFTSTLPEICLDHCLTEGTTGGGESIDKRFDPLVVEGVGGRGTEERLTGRHVE